MGITIFDSSRFTTLTAPSESKTSSPPVGMNKISIGEVDILFIPTGGEDVLDSESAVKVVNLLEPKIVIPMHYSIPKTSIKGEKVDDFLKEMGEKGIKSEEKFTIKKKELPEEGTKIIVLEPAISL